MPLLHANNAMLEHILQPVATRVAHHAVWGTIVLLDQPQRRFALLEVRVRVQV
jgi:hypothetical protein